MRKNTKDKILEIFGTLYEAHDIAKGYINDCKYENANDLLCDCQDTAIEIGNAIADSEGDSFDGICFFEQYCEALYQVATAESISGTDAKAALDEKLKAAENSVKNIQTKLEIVFLPYKASMWDSLESVWKAADADPGCNAYVVPIPYYDRNADGSLGEYHYEGGEYPEYVPVTHYNEYDIEHRHPDIIYIHNPYDDCNRVTSVDPHFYSAMLKKHTDLLVYIPYFVLDAPNNARNFVNTPAINNADRIITQNEQFNKCFIRFAPDNIPKERFLPLGSPKYDKILLSEAHEEHLPEEWRKLIYTADNKRRTIVLYNTSISGVLSTARSIDKIKAVIDTFRQREDFLLWWRPHPLMTATIRSMRPHLYEPYMKLINEFKDQNIGIYDDNQDLDTAITMADAYFGDASSVVSLCHVRSIPVMIQNNSLCDYNSRSFDTVNSFDICKIANRIYVPSCNYNSLMIYDSETGELIDRLTFEGEPLYQQDLFIASVAVKDKIVFVPHKASSIYTYDIGQGSLKRYPLQDTEHFPLFSCAAGTEKLVYMFPACFPYIMTFDPETGALRRLSDLSADGIPPYCSYQTAVHSDKIYVPMLSENKIITVNTRNNGIDITEIGSGNISFLGIASDDNNIYLSLSQQSSILKWDIRNSKITSLVSRSDGHQYMNLYITGETLTATSKVNGRVYEYDLNDGKQVSEKLLTYDNGKKPVLREYRRYSDSGEIYYSNRDGSIHRTSDDSVFIRLEAKSETLAKMMSDSAVNGIIAASAPLNEADPYSLTAYLDALQYLSSNRIRVEYPSHKTQPCGQNIHNKIRSEIYGKQEY